MAISLAVAFTVTPWLALKLMKQEHAGAELAKQRGLGPRLQRLFGAILPLLGLIAPESIRIYAIAAITVVSLAVLGAVGGYLGDAPMARASLRVTVGGALAMAVTAGIGAQKKERYFLDDHDDYSSITLKALADRLAEAFAEALHERVRRDLWGYAPDEALSLADEVAEKYRGIRPAPGYPACPDHSVKRDLFDLLQAGEVGIELTESMAMLPPASVSGFYFSHPQSTYFNVGRIGEDQVQDLALRRGADMAQLKRLLAPNL